MSNIFDVPFEALEQADETLPERTTCIPAERSLLSLAFRSLTVIDGVSEYLKPEHFADEVNGKIFGLMLKAMAAGESTVDVIAITDALDGVASLQAVHAISIESEGLWQSAGNLAKLVFEKAKARQLFAVSQAIATLAFELGPVDERIDKAQAELAKLVTHDAEDDWVDAYTASLQHTALLEQRHRGEVKSIETGLSDLDDMLDGGFHRGNLVVIGARPGMGKSAIGMTIGLHVAQNHSVGFFSLEMPHADVRDRMAAMTARVPISAVKQPAKHNLDYSLIVEAVERSRALQFHVSDRSGLNILQVRARARALKRKKGLDLLVVDYLGLMPGLDSKMQRAYQIEEITKGLKALAKEMDMTVIALAQVNRGVADRSDQTPMLSDLRDSGAIEQDADVVAFINRPIVTKPDLPDDFRNYGLLRVAKNRQGRQGDVHLHYQGDQTRFALWGGPPPSLRTATAPNRKGNDL